MKEIIIPDVESRLSHINSKLADAIELLQTSMTTIKHSRNIIYTLENEIEELYLSLGVEKEDVIEAPSGDVGTEEAE